MCHLVTLAATHILGKKFGKVTEEQVDTFFPVVFKIYIFTRNNGWWRGEVDIAYGTEDPSSNPERV
jgi:hypothetical protein